MLGAQFAGAVMLAAQGADPSANGADYFVTYIRAPQDADPIYDPRFQTWQPGVIARLAGIEYARKSTRPPRASRSGPPLC